VLPETYPGITYDEQGVCNHCHTRKRRRRPGPKALREAIEAHRGSGKYDCIVALSGGRDSCYLAYYVVEELGMHPLLYTYDNGEMPQETWDNIRRIAEVYDLDLATTSSGRVPRYAKHLVSCWMRRPSAAMIGLLCSGCRTGFVQGVTRTAKEHGIPLILVGSGEPALSFAQGLLSTTGGRKEYLPMIAGMAGEWLRNPCYVLDPLFVIALGTEFVYRFWRKRPGGITRMPLFKYLEWDEETIVTTIQDKLGWRKTGYAQSTWRADCKISEFKDYLYYRMLGFTKNDELLSSMVRAGDISREQALTRLQKDNTTSPQFVKEMCSEHGLDYAELERALEKHGVQPQRVPLETDLAAIWDDTDIENELGPQHRGKH
jgi:hypothetical protein